MSVSPKPIKTYKTNKIHHYSANANFVEHEIQAFFSLSNSNQNLHQT